MFGSTFIELGLAVSFLFMLLSLVCTLLGEVASKYLSWRAEMLEESIQQLLRDPDLARSFYKHPMIRSLARHQRPFDKARRLDAWSGPRWPRSWAAWLSRKLDLAAKPSYIKSTNFARAALDVVVLMPRLSAISGVRAKIPGPKAWSDEGERAAFLAQLADAEFDTKEGFADRAPMMRVLIEEKVTDEAARAELLSAFDELAETAEPEPEGEGELTPAAIAARELAEIQVRVAALSNVEARRIFQSLIGKGRVRDRAHAEAIVARYYDDIQERVSGWYKRKSQRWVFMIGASLALILNANTFVIADKLLRDNSIRAIILSAMEGSRDRYRVRVEQAAAAAAPAPPAPSAQPAAPPAGGAPPDVAPPLPDAPAAPLSPSAVAGAASGVDSDEGGHELAQIQELKGEIEKLSLPIGWPERPRQVATSLLRAPVACLIETAFALNLMMHPKREVFERVIVKVERVDEEASKREAQAVKDRKALAEFQENPRGCPDFVCGDQAWGSEWPYYLKKSVLWVIKMAIGWIVTALGASLGAQFWYDAIGRLVSIRTSKKPEDAKEPAPQA